MSRTALVRRTTKESDVRVELDLDGTGQADSDTGVPFFDHMVAQLGRHAGFDLAVRTRGDLAVDAHHTVEDTSIALGQALREALGEKAGLRRFGDALVPLDETLVQAAVDLSGRPYLVHDEPELVALIGTYDTTLTRHVWESLVASGQVALHVRVLSGRNAHHVVEAQFKAVARALRDAVALEPAGQRRPQHQGGAVTRVVVLDYGSGNLRSAQRALERVGAQVELTADRDAAREAPGLVVPGVGAYAACMAGLQAVGGDEVVRRRLADDRPVLGICVGMQVLFECGREHGQATAGIGVLPGEVTRLRADVVPHMGWNTVAVPDGSTLLAGLAQERFYFVHSYAAREVPGALVTVAEHGEPFAAAVERGALSATQFHPEKSADAGAGLLRNWLDTV